MLRNTDNRRSRSSLVLTCCLSGLVLIGVPAKVWASQLSQLQTPASPSIALPAQLPTVTPIQFGIVVPGILAPGRFQYQGRFFEAYQFQGKQGQSIHINLVGSADQRRTNNLSLEPYLALLAPDGRLLEDDMSRPNSVTASLQLNLPATGTYRILVTSAKPGSVGRYSLALQLQGSR